MISDLVNLLDRHACKQSITQKLKSDWSRFCLGFWTSKGNILNQVIEVHAEPHPREITPKEVFEGACVDAGRCQLSLGCSLTMPVLSRTEDERRNVH